MKIKIITNAFFFLIFSVFFSRPAEAAEYGQAVEKIKKVFFDIPAGYQICAVLVLASGIIYAGWKIYQKKSRLKIDWQDYVVMFGENIQTLSFKFGANWKELAKENKLEAPYVVEVGQTIRVPKKEDAKDNRILPIAEKENLSIPENKNIIDLKNVVNKKEESFQAGVNRGMEVNYIVDEQEGSQEAESKRKSSDEIDGSLFFGEEEFDNQKPQKEEVYSIEEARRIEGEASLRTNESRPLEKNNPEEELAFLEEGPSENTIGYSEDLFIKGDEEDAKKSTNRSFYFLILIILILSGVAAFLFFQNKNGKFSLSGMSQIISETKESPDNQSEIAQPENNPIVEEKEEEQIEEIDKSELSTKVLNGSGVAGAAGKIKDFLTENKYEKVTAGNYSSEEVTGSTVYYKEDKFKKAAESLVDILKDKKIEAEVKSASNEEEKSADIVIVLGK